jgi:hypothetical protein
MSPYIRKQLHVAWLQGFTTAEAASKYNVPIDEVRAEYKQWDNAFDIEEIDE